MHKCQCNGIKLQNCHYAHIHEEGDSSRYKTQTHTTVCLIVKMPKCTFMLLLVFRSKCYFWNSLPFETTRHTHTHSNKCSILIMCWCFVISEAINTATRLIFNDIGMCFPLFLVTITCSPNLLYLFTKKKRLKNQNQEHGALDLQDWQCRYQLFLKMNAQKSIYFDYLLLRSTRKIENNETSTSLSSPKNTKR